MIAKIKQKLSSLFRADGEDRGVSPVIGVILMVAITVILAAVIGAFVLGLGDDLGGSTAPNAQVSVDGALTTGTDGEGNSIFAIDSEDVTIEHTQGDSVEVDELRLVVREDGSNIGTIDGADLTQSGDTLDVGDTIKLDTDATGSGLGGYLNDESAAGNEIVIEVVHSPSGTQLASGVVHDDT